MKIWINKFNSNYGPYSKDELEKHLQSGFIKQNDFAIEVGSKEWKKVSDFVILLEECIEDKKVESVKLDSNIDDKKITDSNIDDKNKNNSITKVSFELLKENTIKYILF